MDLDIPDFSQPAMGAPGATGEVRVTEGAFARLAEIAEAEGTPQALRVAVLGGGCSGLEGHFASCLSSYCHGLVRLRSVERGVSAGAARAEVLASIREA